MKVPDGSWDAAIRRLQRLRGRAEPAPVESPRRPPRLIAVMEEGPVLGMLEEAAAEIGWPVDARGELAASGLAIVLVDREFCEQQRREWKGLIRAFARNTPRPYVILLAAHADTNLRDEVERAGGSDLLRKPLDRDRLRKAIAKACQLLSAGSRLRPPVLPFTR